MPKVTNAYHLVVLEDVLHEKKLPKEAIQILLNKLREAEAEVVGKTVAQARDKAKQGQTYSSKKSKKVYKKGDEKGEESEQSSQSKGITQSGDYESKQKHIDSGFVKGAAPGNAGSMYNEIMSGEVANIIRDNPNMSDEELVREILKRHGDSGLANQNKSNKTAGGLKVSEFKGLEDLLGEKNKNKELVAKTILAVRSGRRKAQRTEEAKQDLGWKNTETSEYFGDKDGLQKQKDDISKASKIVNLDGEEIPLDEAIALIDASGGGDNPSDTSTIIFNKDTGEATILFTSDKDSMDAIISQSSTAAEAKQTDDAILKLSDDGVISEEEAEAIAGERRNFAEKKAEIEKELKKVTSAPARHIADNFDSNTTELMKNSSAGSDPQKYWNGQVTRFGNPDKTWSTPLFDEDGNKVEGGQKHKSSDYLKKVGWEEGTEPTEEQMAKAFCLYASEVQNPPSDVQKIVNRVNAQMGGPDVSTKIEEIRNRAVQNEQDSLDFMNQMEVEIDGKKVGLGDYIEGNNIWKQGHLGAISGERGVHKHRGMFEVNNAGFVIDKEVLSKVLGVDHKTQFIQRFEVLSAEEQEELTGLKRKQIGSKGDQKGKTTGSTNILCAIVVDDEGNETKVPIMEKRQRTKDGPLGKFQTVYKWTKQFQDRAKEKN